uniref:Uncharacterized protein n=1 Tax=viral metagenome TaxID=1070528 RepID=A0A6C0HGD4_9ZZZZ
MPRHRRKRGGGIFGPDDPNARTWSQAISDYTPSVFKSKPVSPPLVSQTLPASVQNAVGESQTMAMTAGRRLKKHFGYDPASGKSMRKLLGTAKGDRMLGRRKRRTHRR